MGEGRAQVLSALVDFQHPLHRNQAMKESLRPITSRHTFAGLARTIACMDQAYIPPEPYAKEIEALDSVQPGEVVVVSTGEAPRHAPWGGVGGGPPRAGEDK